ncbi:MAG: twin-arginine translocation signal domain-containing protein [Acidimicrobiales bacterium]|nr:twin-arginine translocation signal domain-containing protein [Acidimicrobiales bacterium]
MDRRRFLQGMAAAGTGIGFGGLSLAACGSDDETSSSSTTAA